MKKCPFCAEEVQDEAIVCKHCKNSLTGFNTKALSTVQDKKSGVLNKNIGCGKTLLIIFILMVAVIAIGIAVNASKSGNDASQSPAVQNNVSDANAKAAASKELKDVMKLATDSTLVRSYEFSEKANVVFVSPLWYTQTVEFKKDFMAKIAMLKESITGYRYFEVRDAYSNVKVGEVTSFTGSLEVYK